MIGDHLLRPLAILSCLLFANCNKSLLSALSSQIWDRFYALRDLGWMATRKFKQTRVKVMTTSTENHAYCPFHPNSKDHFQ